MISLNPSLAISKLTARLVQERGFEYTTLPELFNLKGYCEEVLIRTDGSRFEILCLKDSSLQNEHPLIIQNVLMEVGKNCLQFTGSINGLKMPVTVHWIEIGSEDLSGKKDFIMALKKSSPGKEKIVIHPWYLNLSDKRIWTTTSFFGTLSLRFFLKRFVQNPDLVQKPSKSYLPSASQFNSSPLTITVLLILMLGYLVEMVVAYKMRGSFQLSPNTLELIAMGAFEKSRIMENREWYRFITPVFLHANLIHLLFNCLALYMGGRFLEGMVGRAWYMIVFILSGLGGSVLGFFLNPDYVVSIGASGAIMGIFSTAFFLTYRLPYIYRSQVQRPLLQVLIPSLLPLMVFGSGRVDYAAHFGGALAGLFLWGVFNQVWSKEENEPSRSIWIQGLALLLILGSLVGIGQSVKGYQSISEEIREETLLIPNDDFLKLDELSEKAREEKITQWLQKFPRDPRIHFVAALDFYKDGKNQDAQKELEKILNEKKILDRYFEPGLEDGARQLLANLLYSEGKIKEAKEILKPVCARLKSLELEDLCADQAL